jgi:hypothetical protein
MTNLVIDNKQENKIPAEILATEADQRTNNQKNTMPDA